VAPLILVIILLMSTWFAKIVSFSRIWRCKSMCETRLHVSVGSGLWINLNRWWRGSPAQIYHISYTYIYIIYKYIHMTKGAIENYLNGRSSINGVLMTNFNWINWWIAHCCVWLPEDIQFFWFGWEKSRRKVREIAVNKMDGVANSAVYLDSVLAKIWFRVM
jgi:hypothetical protein